ncbi:MAG TPA: TolC family protein [Bacteroidia bacterium]|nr:TolC family protein [Bacteroidia bacterium]
MRKGILGVLLFFSGYNGMGQTTVTFDSLLSTAFRNHPAILQSQQEILQAEQLKKNSFNLPNPEFGIETPSHDFGWSVSQSIEFPLVYVNQSKLNSKNVELMKTRGDISKSELTTAVRNGYLQLQFALAQNNEFKLQDSLFHALSDANDARYAAGQIGLLEKLNSDNAYQNKHNNFLQAQTDFQNAQQQLHILTGVEISQLIPADSLIKINVTPALLQDSALTALSPVMRLAMQNSSVALQNWKLEKSKLFPGFFGTYFNDNGRHEQITPSRLDLGISIPLWFWSYSGKIKAAKYQWKSANYQWMQTELSLNAQWQDTEAEYKKAFSSLQYFESSAMPQAKTIIDAATRSYKAGEISYVELLQNLNTAFETRLNYLSVLKNYNQSVIRLLKLLGQ